MPGLPHAQLGAELSREQDDALGDKQVLEVDLIGDIGLMRKRSVGRYRHIAVLLAALIVVFATVLATFLYKFPVVSYFVGGESVIEAGPVEFGRWVVAPANGPKLVQFTDGSSAKLAAGARLRVTGTSRRGAALTLESGIVEVRVAGSSVTEYQVGAGPFSLTLQQGQAEISWDPMDELLVIEVHNGFAVISGCQFDTGRTVIAGRELEARCSTG